MGRPRRRRRLPPGPPLVEPSRSREWSWPLLLFAAAFAIRVFFLRATADAGRPDSAYFKGDALLWMDYARAVVAGQSFELGLPLHPPGTAYLLALIGAGGPFGLKLAWCALGALAVVMMAAAIERDFGPVVGRVAGTLMAASTGLLMLSTSLNSETPYLALVAASFYLLRYEPRPGPVAAWAALGGLACLFRVEHALFLALILPFLAVRVRSTPRPGLVLAAAVAGFVLPLLPWHLTAWRAIERFNREAPASSPEALRSTAGSVGGLSWDRAALARREALPAFARDTAATFVAATVAHRGAAQVTIEDFDILSDAFGYEPEPLAARPFVSLYGPLNFALANNPQADGGFSTAALEEPPLLRPRPDAYPADLVRGLPPAELALAYPGHLALVNRGYARGWTWLRREPGRAGRLVAHKLERFWAGAALGFTGYGFPTGVAGTRHAVDLTVPDGGLAVWSWRLGLLAVCALGLAAAGSRPALVPWLAYLGSKAVVAALFFGYARLGATVIPVVALLLALAVERWAATEWIRRVAMAFLLLAVGAEAVRGQQRPALRLDGRAAGPHDPFPADDHRDRVLTVRAP